MQSSIALPSGTVELSPLASGQHSVEEKKELIPSTAAFVQKMLASNLDASEAFFNPDVVPEWVKECVAKKYQGACSEPKQRMGYIFKGASFYVYSSHGFRISSDSIKYALLSKPLKIGDIGSGDNQFVDAMNTDSRIRAIGISAADYRHGDKYDKKTDDYILANAEYLSEIQAFKNMDAIFSRMTYRHFENPAKALLDAYRALRPGGLLVIDGFRLNGFEEWIPDLVGYLKSVGYEVTAHYTCDVWGFEHKKEFDFLSIVKTKEDLTLPIQYEKVFTDSYGTKTTHVGYSPTSVLKEYRAKVRSEAKQQVSIEEVKTALVNLFNDPDYKQLNSKEQAVNIKNLVSKLTSQQLEDNFNLLKRDKELWIIKDYGWIMANYPVCKLAAFVKERRWHGDPEVALAQVIALAALELQVESNIDDCDRFFSRHLGIRLQEEVVSMFDNNHLTYISITDNYNGISILPPSLLKPVLEPGPRVLSSKEENEKIYELDGVNKLSPR